MSAWVTAPFCGGVPVAVTPVLKTESEVAVPLSDTVPVFVAADEIVPPVTVTVTPDELEVTELAKKAILAPAVTTPV
jgi:hypothetical protein